MPPNLQKSIAILSLVAAAVALSSCDQKKASAQHALDYGVLGKPDPSDYSGFDPDIVKRSAADDLSLFRKNEQNPPQGTIDHPINWDVLEEHEDYQRALFYSAAERAPELITQQDWKWVRTEEKDLIQTSCENAGAPGARYQLSDKECASAK
jgi:hypothetical protein